MGRLDLAMEQKVVRRLKQVPDRPRRVLLAVSGGVDSLVMAEILWKWRVGLQFELAVAYVHHGPTPKPEQKRYRIQARNLVHQWAEAHGLRFFTNLRAPALKNESEMRNFREGKLRLWAKKFGASAVAFAHHQDDLLETRLIRLVRGSGQQGLRSMSVLTAGKFRPLLGVSASEIRAYAQVRQLSWLEDPSNDHRDILRNWMRHEWLPSLENKRPGAVNALARSLETITPHSEPVSDSALVPYVGLRRDFLRQASSRERKALLAQYLKALGLKGYAQTHVEEILKRLATERKNLTFDMLGLRFNLSPDFLWASPQCPPSGRLVSRR